MKDLYEQPVIWIAYDGNGEDGYLVDVTVYASCPRGGSVGLWRQTAHKTGYYLRFASRYDDIARRVIENLEQLRVFITGEKTSHRPVTTATPKKLPRRLTIYWDVKIPARRMMESLVDSLPSISR